MKTEDCNVEYTEKRDMKCGSKLIRTGKKPSPVFCTRLKHHKGEHHAHNKYGACYARWT